MENTEKKRIAVVGAGVAGIVTAYLLSRRHDVTLIEKNDYIGGHTNTIDIQDGSGAVIPVDTGFIVLNDRTYPLFNRFLSQLGVAIGKTDMSFSYRDGNSNLQYASMDFRSIFAQRTNLFSPSFWRLLYGILRFNRLTRQRLHEGALTGLTIDEHLRRESISDIVAKAFVLPMAGAIWSAPDGSIREFPVETFARFYENHGLLSLSDHPQWYYVEGGSQTYVRAFLKTFAGRVLSSCPVKAVIRDDRGVVLKLPNTEERFDKVVIAAHADQAYRMLANPSENETRLLSVWKYAPNRTILHSDDSFLPPIRRAWASWNYTRAAGNKDEAPVALTYDMTRLQCLPCKDRVCVTLNPWKPVSKAKTIRELQYDHPMYNFDALRSQAELPSLSGQKNTYFCGSYFGYGFHEDAVRSAVELGKLFDIGL
jgi:predicted NAD/FAD-binding protein